MYHKVAVVLDLVVLLQNLGGWSRVGGEHQGEYLRTWSVGNDEVYTDITLAVMMLHVGAANGTRMLDSNYSDPGSTSKTYLQKGWQQGLQIYRDQLNKLGGFPIVNSTNVRHQVWTNVLFFAVALPSDNSSVQLEKMTTFMYEALNGSWGYAISVFIAPPTPYLDAAPVDQLSWICETTRACIMILPITIDPNVYICQPQPDTGIVQADCTLRGRSTGRRRFDYTISTAPPSLQVADLWLQMLALRQMKTVVIIRCTNWRDQAMAAFREISKLGLRVAVDLEIPPTETRSVDQWSQTIQGMYAMHPDIDSFGLFIGYSTSEAQICVNIMRAFKYLNIYPKAIDFVCSCQATAPSVYSNWSKEGLQDYAYGVAPWHPQALGPDYSPKTSYTAFEPFESTDTEYSPAVFWKVALQRFSNTTGLASPAIVAQAATAVLLVQKAYEIMSIVPPSVDDLREGFRLISQPSHHGNILLTRYGTRADSPYPHLQYVNGVGRLLAPVGPHNPVYPAPTWDEREYRPEFFSQPSETVFLVLYILSVSFAAFILIELVIYRNHPVIRAATHPFCIVIVLGAIVFMTSILVWTLHENDSTCMAKIWLLFIGFLSVMTAIAVKTHRINAIFNRQDLQVVTMSTTTLGIILGCICGFAILILIIWSVSDPPHAVVVVSDIYRPSTNVSVCRSDTGTTVFQPICLVIAAICLLANVYYAYRIRNVPDEFNESIYIGYSMYGIAILFIIIVPVVAFTEQRGLSFYVRSIGILISGISLLGFIFVPKLRKIHHQQKMIAYKMNSTLKSDSRENRPMIKNVSEPAGSDRSNQVEPYTSTERVVLKDSSGPAVRISSQTAAAVVTVSPSPHRMTMTLPSSIRSPPLPDVISP